MTGFLYSITLSFYNYLKINGPRVYFFFYFLLYSSRTVCSDSYFLSAYDMPGTNLTVRVRYYCFSHYTAMENRQGKVTCPRHVN